MALLHQHYLSSRYTAYGGVPPSSHAALIHGIRAQGLTPEYRRTATSTGNILVKANPSGNIIEKVSTLLPCFLCINADLNKGDAIGSDKLLKGIVVSKECLFDQRL